MSNTQQMQILSSQRLWFCLAAVALFFITSYAVYWNNSQSSASLEIPQLQSDRVLARVVSDDRYYFVDKREQTVAGPFDYASDIRQCTSLLAQGSRLYMADFTSGTLSPLKSDFAWPGTTDIDLQRMGRTWYITDKETGLSKSTQHAMILPFSEGLAAFLKNGKWGFVSKEGTEVIKPVYDDCGFFRNGIAAVNAAGKRLLIDKAGRVVEKRAERQRATEELRPKVVAGRTGYESPDGEVRIPLRFREGKSFSCGRAAVRTDWGWGYIDQDGTFVSENYYSYAGQYRAISHKGEASDSFADGIALLEYMATHGCTYDKLANRKKAHFMTSDFCASHTLESGVSGRVAQISALSLAPVSIIDRKAGSVLLSPDCSKMAFLASDSRGFRDVVLHTFEGEQNVEVQMGEYGAPLSLQRSSNKSFICITMRAVLRIGWMDGSVRMVRKSPESFGEPVFYDESDGSLLYTVFPAMAEEDMSTICLLEEGSSSPMRLLIYREGGWKPSLFYIQGYGANEDGSYIAYDSDNLVYRLKVLPEGVLTPSVSRKYCDARYITITNGVVFCRYNDHVLVERLDGTRTRHFTESARICKATGHLCYLQEGRTVLVNPKSLEDVGWSSAQYEYYVDLQYVDEAKQLCIFVNSLGGLDIANMYLINE